MLEFSALLPEDVALRPTDVLLGAVRLMHMFLFK
jgi:hypothetical protein